MDKREQLRALMAAGGWRAAEVASMLGRGVQTVYSWLTRPERIPPDVLRILTLELRIRELEGGLYGKSKTPKPAGRIKIRRTVSMKGPSSDSTAKGPQGEQGARNRRRGN